MGIQWVSGMVGSRRSNHVIASLIFFYLSALLPLCCPHSQVGSHAASDSQELPTQRPQQRRSCASSSRKVSGLGLSASEHPTTAQEAVIVAGDSSGLTGQTGITHPPWMLGWASICLSFAHNGRGEDVLKNRKGVSFL